MWMPHDASTILLRTTRVKDDFVCIPFEDLKDNRHSATPQNRSNNLWSILCSELFRRVPILLSLRTAEYIEELVESKGIESCLRVRVCMRGIGDEAPSWRHGHICFLENLTQTRLVVFWTHISYFLSVCSALSPGLLCTRWRPVRGRWPWCAA